MEPTGEAKGDSIATTIALTVIVAMVLGLSLQQLVSSGLLYLGVARQQNVRNGNPRLLLQLPGRIAVLLDVLDATPDTKRPIVVAAAQRPLCHPVDRMGAWWRHRSRQPQGRRPERPSRVTHRPRADLAA